jgi:hypothetical protein
MDLNSAYLSHSDWSTLAKVVGKSGYTSVNSNCFLGAYSVTKPTGTESQIHKWGLWKQTPWYVWDTCMDLSSWPVRICVIQTCGRNVDIHMKTVKSRYTDRKIRVIFWVPIRPVVFIYLPFVFMTGIVNLRTSSWHEYHLDASCLREGRQIKQVESVHNVCMWAQPVTCRSQPLCKCRSDW